MERRDTLQRFQVDGCHNLHLIKLVKATILEISSFVEANLENILYIFSDKILSTQSLVHLLFIQLKSKYLVNI
jgi:hypothetical protein